MKPPSIPAIYRNLSTWLGSILILLICIAVFVPFHPAMPRAGLDPSWVSAMNDIVARSLILGKDIVLTFGPYASVYTETYHPGVDHLMIGGSLYLALSFAAMLIVFMRKERAWPALLFTAGLLTNHDTPDALLFIYPPLLVLFVAWSGGQAKITGFPPAWLALALTTPLGLLPLIKGSLLPITGITIGAIFLYFACCRKYASAICSVLLPVFAGVLLWVLSGQPLLALPGYFITMGEVMSGYTQAMAKTGTTLEIISYLVAAGALIGAIGMQRYLAISVRLLIVTCFAFFFFNVFKAGFVRHDGHALIAADCLFFAALMILLIVRDKMIYATVAISFLAWACLSIRHLQPNQPFVLQDPRLLYRDTCSGVAERLHGKTALNERYLRSLAEIRAAEPLPAVSGTADIYSAHQSALLASGNQWNPRPVFQSYPAYTPWLARINEQHLRSTKAPDHIFFRVEPIDERWPSLEDGSSWPALLDNYRVRGLSGNLVHLEKQETLAARSDFRILHDASHRLGEVISLPKSQSPLFAEIEIQPTLAGRVLTTGYKTTELWMTVKLSSQQTHRYRIIPNMMRTGFFLSPLIASGQEFALLATGHERALASKKVLTISVAPLEEAFPAWRESYRLVLREYRRKVDAAISAPLLAPILDAPPAELTIGEPIKVSGNISSINGTQVKAGQQQISDVLVIEGVLAVNPRSRLTLDHVWITLRNASGQSRYAEAKLVTRYRKRYAAKGLISSDVSAVLDVSQLEGEWQIGMAIQQEGKLLPCERIAVPVTIARPAAD